MRENENNVSSGLKNFKLRRKTAILNGIFLKNPILVTGVVIAPAAVAAYSLKTALALAIVMFTVTVPTVFMASVIRKYIKGTPEFLLPVIYVLISAVMLIPSFFIVRLIFGPPIINAMGIYGPLLAFNSVLFSRAKKYPRKKRPLFAALDAVCYSVGFAISICAVGAVREILGAGTVWGVPVGNELTFFGFLMPFGGCIVVAFLSAFARQLVVAVKRLARRVRTVARLIKRRHEKKAGALWKGNGAL